MADKKITQLDAVTTTANTDLLLLVRDPSGTPVNKKIELGDVFGESAQTVFQKMDLKATGNATLAGNTVILDSNNAVQLDGGLDVISDRIRVRTSLTPANSNNTLVGWQVGTIAWDTNYLYIAVSSSQIARIAANTSW